MQDGKQAVIIGVGPAGLTAAYELLKTTGIHPILLEADDCVGGIARTVEYAGNRMDIGGHRFFTKDREIQELWNEILPQPENAEIDAPAFLLRNRVSRIFYQKHLFPYPVSLNADTFRGLGCLNSVGIGLSYLASCIHKKEEHSLEDFMVNRFGQKLYQTFFEKYTEKVWGRSPKAIDADWGSQRIKGISLWAVVKDFLSRSHKGTNEASLIQKFLYPKLGPGQFFQTLANRVTARGGEIRFGCRVHSIIGTRNRVTGVRYLAKDRTLVELPADFILSSMPIRDLSTALPNGVLPSALASIASRLPYRDFMTVGLLVRKLAVRNIHDQWIYVQEPDVKLGRLQIFNNWSPYLVKDAGNTVWLGLEYFCQEGDALWKTDDRSFLHFAIGELSRIGIIEKEDVLDGCVLRMEKAYPAYFDPYKDFPAVRRSLQGIGGLYCIGRNGQHRYNNMDHSMRTAIEAVRVIRGESSQEALWNVNTEKDYHENHA